MICRSPLGDIISSGRAMVRPRAARPGRQFFPTRQRQNHHRKSEGNSLYYHLCIDYIDYVDTYSCYLYIHTFVIIRWELQVLE